MATGFSLYGEWLLLKTLDLVFRISPVYYTKLLIRPGFTDRLYRLQPVGPQFGRPTKITGKRFKKNICTISKLLTIANLNVKLQDPTIGLKKWWGLVKSLYGNKIQSTVPTIYENDRLITDAKEKATLFNEYFTLLRSASWKM